MSGALASGLRAAILRRPRHTPGILPIHPHASPTSSAMRTVHLALVLALSALSLPSAAAAQAVDPQNPRPRVFFDCQGPQCDLTYYRTEIVWVDWVRDAQDSNVHVIMTSQNTGAGGREYLLDFIGRGSASEYLAQSRYRAGSTDTQREELDGVAYTLALGLAQFANSEGFGTMLQIAPLAEF